MYGEGDVTALKSLGFGFHFRTLGYIFTATPPSPFFYMSVFTVKGHGMDLQPRDLFLLEFAWFKDWFQHVKGQKVANPFI